MIKTVKVSSRRPENNKEKQGWLTLAERNIAKLWDNIKDDKEWVKYFKDKQKFIN